MKTYANQIINKSKIHLELAKKYERLAARCKSPEKRAKLFRKSNRYYRLCAQDMRKMGIAFNKLADRIFNDFDDAFRILSQ